MQLTQESFKYKIVLQGVLTLLMEALLLPKVMKSIILIMMQTNLAKKVGIVVPLKYLSNFSRYSINCEVTLFLTWSENRVVASLEKNK